MVALILLTLFASPAGGQTKIAVGVTVITPDAVGRFLSGLHAEMVERNRIRAEHASDNLGLYYEMRERHARCDSVLAAAPAREAEWQNQFRLVVSSGDTLRAKKHMAAMQALQTDRQKASRCDDRQRMADNTQQFFDALRAAQAREDAAGAKAGGFSIPEYGSVRERVAAYLFGGPWGAVRQPVGYLASETTAIDARRAELIALLRRDFNARGSPKGTYER